MHNKCLLLNPLKLKDKKKTKLKGVKKRAWTLGKFAPIQRGNKMTDDTKHKARYNIQKLLSLLQLKESIELFLNCVLYQKQTNPRDSMQTFLFTVSISEHSLTNQVQSNVHPICPCLLCLHPYLVILRWKEIRGVWSDLSRSGILDIQTFL